MIGAVRKLETRVIFRARGAGVGGGGVNFVIRKQVITRQLHLYTPKYVITALSRRNHPAGLHLTRQAGSAVEKQGWQKHRELHRGVP